MKRLLIVLAAATAVGFAVIAMMLRPDVEPAPWKTTDVWYHESDVAQIGRTGRPQLVEFFHPD